MDVNIAYIGYAAKIRKLKSAADEDVVIAAAKTIAKSNYAVEAAKLKAQGYTVAQLALPKK